MRKTAYHRIRLTDGTLINSPVIVTTDDYGTLISWHKLECEEPATVWVGGEYQC